MMVNNFTSVNTRRNHLSPHIIEHEQIMTYNVGNAWLCLGQTHICREVKQVDGIPTISLLAMPSPTAIQR
jgi:hypothetical protein